MEKFIPYEKLSKKEKRKLDLAKRQTWGELNPVTRKPTNSKAYNRNKARDWKREYHEPISGFSYILPCIFRYCSMICAVCSAPMEVSTSKSYCLRSPHSWPEMLR